MPVESVDTIADLDPAFPAGNEDSRDGDNHIRNVKKVVKLLGMTVPGSRPVSSRALEGNSLLLTSANMRIQPEGSNNTGVLLTLTGYDDLADGTLIRLQGADPTKQINIRHGTGAGQIRLRNAVGDETVPDFALNDEFKSLWIRKHGSVFYEEKREVVNLGSAMSRNVGVDSASQLPTRGQADERYLRKATAEIITAETLDIQNVGNPQFTLRRTASATPSSMFMRAEATSLRLGTVTSLPLAFIMGAISRMVIGTQGGVYLQGGWTAVPGGSLSAEKIFDLDGVELLAKGFASDNIAFGSGADTQAVNHGLGAVPKQVRVVLVCTTSNLGYAVGDEVVIHSNDTSSAQKCIAVFANATQVGWVQSNTPQLPNKSSGAISDITTSSWRLKFYAWR